MSDLQASEDLKVKPENNQKNEIRLSGILVIKVKLKQACHRKERRPGSRN